MNERHFEDMRATLYVPYSNGDPVRGFSTERDFTREQYAGMMIKDYESHRDGVDVTFSERFGSNLAYNPFVKERRNYGKQDYYFAEVECQVYDIDNKDASIDELLSYKRTGEPFVVILALLNLSSDPDLETDVSVWERECVKVNGSNRMTEDEKLKCLSKKDLKLKFKDSKYVSILRGCKMIDVFYRNKFAVLVEGGILFMEDKL